MSHSVAERLGTVEGECDYFSIDWQEESAAAPVEIGEITCAGPDIVLRIIRRRECGSLAGWLRPCAKRGRRHDTVRAHP
jgi:hypothetical protein